MKKIITVLALAAVSLTLKAQTALSQSSPTGEMLVLREASFDFGKIPQGRPVTHEFEFLNVAKDTLRLENVQASCGCTTPIWNKDPVTAGASGKINVGYNALAEGSFEKVVTLYYNGGQIKTLTIKGNVYKTPATSAPQNASLELIKQ